MIAMTEIRGTGGTYRSMSRVHLNHLSLSPQAPLYPTSSHLISSPRYSIYLSSNPLFPKYNDAIYHTVAGRHKSPNRNMSGLHAYQPLKASNQHKKDLDLSREQEGIMEC